MFVFTRSYVPFAGGNQRRGDGRDMHTSETRRRITWGAERERERESERASDSEHAQVLNA